jgi:D-tyrosyl-tRNA(Tyr) deacylase
VSRAAVTVNDTIVGRLDSPGLVVLVGITHEDGPDEVAWLARKVRELRIMREEQSVADLGAPVLVVSQFTLYGDARKGRRPTWAAAAPGSVAEPLYDALCAEHERHGTRDERGDGEPASAGGANEVLEIHAEPSGVGAVFVLIRTE